MCQVLNIVLLVLTMELVQTANYSPQLYAYFPHQTHPLLTLHPSARYFSFQTRAHQLILCDVSTGRMTILYKAQHPFKCNLFTNDYLLAAHATSHEILVFSLRAGKLKTRMTGHLADVKKLAYCRQTDLIASISNDYCLIHTQKSLTYIKTLKCSTSAFVDCQFALAGSQFFTSFKDGSVLLWNPNDWSHRSSAVIVKSPKIATSYGIILSVYTGNKLWLCDVTQQIVNHQQIGSFWQGQIKQLVFIDNSIVLSTTQGTYVAELQQKNSFKVNKVLKLDLISACISHTHYQSTLCSLSLDMKRIQTFSLVAKTSNLIKRTNNPLTNEGLVCAGGYDNQQGCHTVNNIYTNNCYSTAEMTVQPITQACYAQIPNKMNKQQLKQFILKNHALPDKYRPIAYRHVLKLPISTQQFKQLQRKGSHPSTQLLSSKYPIPNKQLAQSMRLIMSLLAHWEPVLGQSDLVPPIVFGFVCLFGKDTFFCFQLLVRLFAGPLSFLFVQFPLANSLVLQNMWEILKQQDDQLCQHFELSKIRFTRLAWGLLSSFFTSILNRQNFLAIADLVLIRVDQPQMILFVCLGYLIFNRKRFLSTENEQEASLLCEEQQTIHLGKFLNTVNKIHAKNHMKIRYNLKVWLQRGHYQKLSVPKQAVILQEQKRNIVVEQLQKQKQNEYEKQKMLQEMQKMIVKARRQAQRQLIQSQAYQLHTQNQNNPIHIQPVNRSVRIHKLESLIQELTVALERQQIGRDQVRQYVPAFELIKNANDSTLDGLQLKLVQLLSQLRPANSLRPFLAQPINIIKKSQNTTGLRGALGARLASKLWQMDQLYNEGHGSRWQQGLLAATTK